MLPAKPSSVVFPLFLLGILLSSVVLIFFLGVVREQIDNSPRLSTKIPEEFILTTDDSRFATNSASLISKPLEMKPQSRRFLFNLFFAQDNQSLVHFDEKLVRAWIASIADNISTPSARPRIITAAKPPQLTIYPGNIGRSIDIDATTENILKTELGATNSASLVIVNVGSVLSPDGVIASERRAQAFRSKSLRLITPSASTTLRNSSLLSLLSLPSGFDDEALTTLLEEQQQIVTEPPVEPELELSGREVHKFIAPKPGVVIDDEAFLASLRRALGDLESGSPSASVSIPIKTRPPKNSIGDVNTLGIVDRLGIGESVYAHSIPNRIFNVSHTAKKIHGILIFPQEEFSFNTYLGEVSKRTGFKEAYIIKDGQTILGDGGGVCQVSSTLFRAVLDAGLPITARKGHSYRVGYYEQNSKPGFDATVYAPQPDFRFVNDTATPILLNVVADSERKTMAVEIWGAPDGRKAEIRNYRQWDSVPAPPPLYQDDPSLRRGQVRQIEYAASGLKTSFDYVVRMPTGEERVVTYKTNYIPWRAVYLRGPS